MNVRTNQRVQVIPRPQKACAACGNDNEIRVLVNVETSDGPAEIALCLNFIQCNRRWGFDGKRHGA